MIFFVITYRLANGVTDGVVYERRVIARNVIEAVSTVEDIVGSLTPITVIGHGRIDFVAKACFTVPELSWVERSEPEVKTQSD